MSGTTISAADRLQAFNERLASGRAPQPGEPHTALEAMEALAAERGADAASPTMWEIARRIHDAELADAHQATN